MDSEFRNLVDKYQRSKDEAERDSLEADVWDKYGIEQAVLVLDMAGFSRLTESHGIVQYLAMVRHMQIVVEPIVDRFKGHLVKFEADNGFARFDDVQSAIQAAIAINIGLDAMNMMTVDELDIHVSTGIDYGRFLLVGDDDYFGSPVNVACKLGEDLAGPGEILVTENAFSEVPEDAGIKGSSVNFRISGLEIAARKVDF